MAEQNSKVVGGGVILLLLWGGLGLFFGVGKGKGNGQNKADKPEQRAQTPPRERPKDRVVTTKRSSPLVNTALQEPAATRTQGLSATKPPVRNIQPGPSTPGHSHRFTFVLRLKYIHPMNPDGTVSNKTISLQELVAQGKQAALAKQELHLRVRGDARARWEHKVKQVLREGGVTFSVTNEF